MPDFKFELLPLHSPLLGQSLLVSFPPLIDMLKFSGYPYLIRGQPGVVCSDGDKPPETRKRIELPQRFETDGSAGDIGARGGPRRPRTSEA